MINKLFKAACEIAEERFSAGEALAAAALTDKGNVLTSVWVEAAVDSACLCAETGAICEAHKLGERIIQVVCVAGQKGNFAVLPPCGVCQERLAVFGMDVQIAVSGGNSNNIIIKTLADLRPHYWADSK